MSHSDHVSQSRGPGSNRSARMLSRDGDLRINDYPLDERTHVVEVAGQIDLYTAPEFRQRTHDVISRGTTRVIADLSGVGFMDSTGLSVVVSALKRLRTTGGALSLIVTDYDIERLLEITGLDGSVTIYRTREEALDDLAVARD
jgi:anti-sigma B factor antagonist